MRRNLERTSSEPFLKISTPRAGSQTRVDLIGVEAISGEGGPTEEDTAVSFEADLAPSTPSNWSWVGIPADSG